MRNELTVGDFNSSYYKLVYADDAVQERVFANEEEARLAAMKTDAKLLKISKRVLHTLKFERIY